MKEICTSNINNTFINDIRAIINTARSNAMRSVDFQRVQMYWHLGKRIFEEEQQGKQRADYGTYLIKNLAKQLEPEYGSGFSVRQLEMCRQFYRIYPIANAVRSQLNWTQYRMLIQIPDPDKREYYELEAVNNSWTGRELERQINSILYERHVPADGRYDWEIQNMQQGLQRWYILLNELATVITRPFNLWFQNAPAWNSSSNNMAVVEWGSIGWHFMAFYYYQEISKWVY